MYRLLIVDDEALIRNGLHKIIPWGELGFEVAGSVGSAGEALAILRKEPVDILLTDIQMPGTTGLELSAEARELLPQIKVVIISGYDQFEYALSAVKLQVEDYILKPIKPDEIKSTFRSLKQKLDDEHKSLNEHKKRVKVQNEYGILQIIGSELTDAGQFRQRVGNAPYIRLVLLFLSQGEDAGDPDYSRLYVIFRNYYCINTNELFAVFLPSEQVLELLAQLDGYFSGAGGVAYKIAVSQEIHHFNDAYGAFLEAAEKLDDMAFCETLFCDTNGAREKRQAMDSLTKKLIRELEDGRTAAIDATVKELIAFLGSRSLANSKLLCANLLLEVARYFRLDTISDFGLFGSNAAPPENLDTLEAMLLADINKVLRQLRENADGSSAVLVQRAKQYIDKNYTDSGFSLRDIADNLNISYNYLSTVFTKCTGTPLKSYLTAVRMEKARGLILERELKIYRIGEMVGYSNPRYFTDAFRKYFGMSPKEYAQRLGDSRHE